jgi:hypothetical protein
VNLSGKAFYRTARWRELVEASPASAEVKASVIKTAEINGLLRGETVDCFEMGLAMGALSNVMEAAGLLDQFLLAIRETRDLNKLPLVKLDGNTVQ